MNNSSNMYPVIEPGQRIFKPNYEEKDNYLINKSV